MSEIVSISVAGMKCSGCEKNLSSKLSELSGVLAVTSSHLDKKVDVEYDQSIISVDEIEDAIIAAGFSVE